MYKLLYQALNYASLPHKLFETTTVNLLHPAVTEETAEVPRGLVDARESKVGVYRIACRINHVIYAMTTTIVSNRCESWLCRCDSRNVGAVPSFR